MKNLKYILLLIFLIFIDNLLLILFLSSGFNDEYEIIIDTNKYSEVIGTKYEMEEDIFPSSITDKNVLDFKYVYYNPWDANYLMYLVIDYSNEDYIDEVSRLNDIGIKDYIGIYGVTGFSNYKLLAMNADSYNGFIYAITDNESKIIYVELLFCNYYMDIKYDKIIPNMYLPDGFDATIDNNYKKLYS